MFNVTLQRHCSKHIYVVPEGLREIMSDISREVLRNTPNDIYTFIADYLDALLITRENARVAARFVIELNDCAQTIVNFLNRTGLQRNRVDMIASIIQKAFRAHLERTGILKEDEQALVKYILDEAEIPEEEAEAAAVIIQDAFRKFKHRKQKEHQLFMGVIDWRIAARSAIKLYRKSGVSHEEAKKAANLIKTAYRGYYTRRALIRLKQMQDEQWIDTFDAASEDSEKRKAVRIDMQTVVPHVGFGDSDVIEFSGAEVTSAVTEMSKGSETTIEFVKSLISDAIVGPAIGEPPKEVSVPSKESTSKMDAPKPQASTLEKMSSHEELIVIARQIIEEIIPLDDLMAGDH